MGVVLPILQVVQYLLRIDNVGFHAYLMQKLSLPFFAEHRGAEYNEPTKIEATSQFCPYQTCFYRLAETDFVGNEQSVAWRVEESQHWLELVRVEVCIGTLHTIDNIRQSPSEPDVGQCSAKIHSSPEFPHGKEVNRTLLLVWQSLQLICRHPTFHVCEPDLDQYPTLASLLLA